MDVAAGAGVFQSQVSDLEAAVAAEAALLLLLVAVLKLEDP